MAERRLRRLRAGMTRGDWARLGAFGGAIAFLHILGIGLFLLAVLHAKSAAIGIGTALTAYTLGTRHAFDADHIAAIDNTTRKLMADGRRPMGVGFFFSLGHSTVVLALSSAIALAAGAISSQVGQNTRLHQIGGFVGTSVSAFFLYVIAAINLVILVGIVRIFREMRQGHYDEETLERKLQERGLINRLLGPLARSIRHSWQMYPLGLLFGLGFDTATEIGLLALAGGSAASGLPWYGTLCLPILFAAGMSLFDTADGAFMSVAYGWAFSQPVRKVFYNLTITGLSVGIALIIGTVEVLSVIANALGLHGGLWSAVSSLDLNILGFVIVGLFVLTWAVALGVWRFGRIEERWTLAPVAADGERWPPGQNYTGAHEEPAGNARRG